MTFGIIKSLADKLSASINIPSEFYSDEHDLLIS